MQFTSTVREYNKSAYKNYQKSEEKKRLNHVQYSDYFGIICNINHC